MRRRGFLLGITAGSLALAGCFQETTGTHVIAEGTIVENAAYALELNAGDEVIVEVINEEGDDVHVFVYREGSEENSLDTYVEDEDEFRVTAEESGLYRVAAHPSDTAWIKVMADRK